VGKKTSNFKSDCCNAKMRVMNFNDSDKACTFYYLCTHCNKPCEPRIKIRRTWTRNPAPQIIKDKREKQKRKQIKKEIEENK
jgi:hypothetical protein